MIDETGNDTSNSILLHAVYAAEFRNHAIELLCLGYRRLDRSSLRKAEEDVITGELVRQMRAAIEDAASPDWTQHYSVNEQQRMNVAAKLGKRRPIVDIEFERHSFGRRPLLGFEAKRLCTRKSGSEYVGSEGLAAFVDGYYPTSHGEAGMLGYIQLDTDTVWARKLAAAISRKARALRLTTDGGWTSLPATPSALPAFRTRHTAANENQMLVLHLLLPLS